MKRTFDILIGIGLLPLAAPLCLIAMIVLGIEMRANPLFLQTRVGRYRQPFTILKLRTMRPGTEHVASHEIKSCQITRMGGLVRRSKIDELPQILNVLKGDMSFVGPRPCLQSQSELVSEREQRGVFALRPGITGPAQLAGIDMSQPRRLAKADAAYLEGWSLTQDIKMVFHTFLGKGSGDPAVVRK
ncbi:sugar transferase [Altererythrobacter sp. SALINAS58]|uniref:sugar transferase n=1 Tax=Alteripontixanthobacter muriae TaxID=2705546 RepID=UPI00157775AE|nr:sugar transferase [Alteripontixanthobacter muriae]NTZ43417.1 sugar transferase [Alteripontixanthobacter muriae]